MRCGITRDQYLGSSHRHERASAKTKQMKNLARLYTIGTIGLKQYITSLSNFVGDFTKDKKKNNINPSTTVTDTEIADGEN